VIPVEACIFVLLVAFGLVGMSRSFPRELGATIGFIGLLVAFELLGLRVGPLAARGMAVAGFPMAEDLAAWVAYSAAIAVTVYFVYQGETLTFNSIAVPGPIGKAFDFAVGMFNGWLVIGSWWHYTHWLGYPIQRFGWFTPPLTTRAQRLVELTPLDLLPPDRTLVYLAGFLVVLLSLKVVR
jgi:hypothetical protein